MKLEPQNLDRLPTEITHHGTTHVKRLVRTEENHKGDVATMNYAWLESGKQLTTHSHPDGEEFYLFIEGTGEILVGETWHAIDKGSFVVIPMATLHSVKNTGKQNLVFITTRTLLH